MSRSRLRGFDPAAFQRARIRAGMTPGDVARLAGIRAPLTIRRWEAGQSRPSIDVLRLAIEAMAAEHKKLDEPPVTAAEVILTEPSSRFLSDWRHLQLLTQRELAERAGLGDQATVAYLESAQLALTPDTADRLAAGLAIPVDEVYAAHERARVRRPGTPA